MKRCDLYIIGPVTGYPDRNRKAFEEARAKLEALGYSVAIPHDFIPESADWGPAMQLSISYMLTQAKAVAVLDGPLSPGSRIEFNICIDTHKLVGRVSYWLKRRTFPIASKRGPEWADAPALSMAT